MLKIFVYTHSDSLKRVIINQLSLVGNPIEIKPNVYIPKEPGLFILDMREPYVDKVIKRLNSDSFIFGLYGTMLSESDSPSFSKFDSMLSEKFYIPFHLDLFFQKVIFYKTQFNKRKFSQIFGDRITVNPSLNLVTIKTKRLAFTELEYALVEYLLFNSDHIVTKLELLTQIKSSRGYISIATLQVLISNIRRKFRRHNIPITIQSIYKRGYKCDLSAVINEPMPIPLFSSCS